MWIGFVGRDDRNMEKEQFKDLLRHRGGELLQPRGEWYSERSVILRD